MNIEKLREPLDISQIDFRTQSINKGGYATILAYKDARVDVNRLNEVIGALNWQDKYELINGNLFCSVGIYNEQIKDWVWKQNVGTESNTEKEKGQASDAFKRACFNWGIGIELYDYPLIQIQLQPNEFKIENFNNKEVVRPTWDLKIKEWVWGSKFEGNKIVQLAAKDENSKVRFNWKAK
jgi:hypothetical protein